MHGSLGAALLALAFAVALSGCNEDGPITDLLVDRTPTSISIGVEPRGRLDEGDTAVVAVTVRDQRGEPFDYLPPWALAWRSSDTAVVRASEGNVLAVGGGRAEVTVASAGMEASAAFEVNPSVLRVEVAGVQLVQAVQRMDGGVPLVAGRAAYLRVFTTGDVVNFFRPAVDVTLFHDGSPTRTLRVPARGEGVPVVVDEGDRSRSWDALIPADEVRPGLAVRVAVDPDGTIPRAAGSVDRYPADGAAAPVDVREVPEFRLRFVPVHQSAFATDEGGDVTAANIPAYLGMFLEVFPIERYDVEMRNPYTTTAVTSEGRTDAHAIIQEIRALRIAEGASRYYYGVYRRHGAGGGLGYLGYPVAIGTDGATQRGREDGRGYTFAHELGHNFDRRHAPCNTTADTSYPYDDGRIGHWGWDARIDSVIPPWTPDVMSYCPPGWSSDYTYEAVLEFREREADAAGPGSDLAATAGAGPVLVVWGAVSDGEIVIHPAFTLDSAGDAGDAGDTGGRYRLEGLDEDGAVLFSRAFAGRPLPDAGAGERHFLLTIPLAEARPDRLSRLRVQAGGRVVERRARTLPSDDRLAALEAGLDALRPRRVEPGRVRLRWDAARFPLAIVRDAGTGEVLSFARGGDAEVITTASQLDLSLSDGILSRHRAVPVER